jgi:hypothetical protein
MRTAGALLAIAAGMIALQIAGTILQPTLPGLPWIRRVITDPAATSYFAAAEEIIDFERRRPDIAPLRHYHAILPYFPLHARTKPFVPVFIHLALLRTAGSSATPLLVATIVALLAAGSAVATYFAVVSADAPEAALDAAALVALAPAMMLFFPELDVAYPLVSAGVLATWPRALMRADRICAAAFGALMFVASILSYSLLTIGAFWLWTSASYLFQRRSLSVLAKLIAIAGAVFVGANIALWAFTGYDPIATFRAALTAQQWIAAHLPRTYPASIPFDLIDFALGAGWVPIVLGTAFVFGRRSEQPLTRSAAIAGFAMPFVVAITGLLQAETARVWAFMLPLVAFPAALALARLTFAQRLLIFASLLLVTVALYTNMRFIVMLT